MNDGGTHIAGWKTADDWRAFRKLLVVGADLTRWQSAFDDYFRTRLDFRYLNPIQLLQKNGTFQGEGFSIMAIECTLIEFLESTLQGVNYRYVRKGDPPLGPFEYSSSAKLFVNFLSTRKPFLNDFDEAWASDFYANVRCGLLHEASTKNGWKVWAKGPVGVVIDKKERRVYRDNFHTAVEEFIASYGTALKTEPALQQAFIRKFDNLCE